MSGIYRFTLERPNMIQKGLAHHVVIKLMQGLEGKGFNLIIDNWYSSPGSFHDLAEDKILACGTVRANGKGLPKDIMDLKAGEMKSMERRQSVTSQKDALLSVCGRTASMFIFWSV